MPTSAVAAELLLGPTFAVRLVGDIDIAVRGELDGVVEDFLESTCTQAAVDLACVSFMDTTGVALLLDLSRIAGERGGRVALLGTPPCVHRALDLLGLADLFA